MIIAFVKKSCSSLLARALVCIFYTSFGYAEIVIGLDADMSRAAADGGKSIRLGAEIAIDEINERGGVLGQNLKLIVKDHRGNPARGVDNIQGFVAEKNLVAVLSGVHTPVALQELELVHREQINFLIPWAAGTPVVDNGYDPNYVFRVSVRDQYAGGFLMEKAKQRGFKRVALFLERTGWGRSNEKSMGAAAAELGLDVADIVWFNWGQKSIKAEMDQALEKDIDAILLVSNAPEGALIAKELLALPKDQRPAILSHWGITGGAFVNRVGVDNLQQLDLSFLQTFSFLNPHNPELSDRVFNALNDRVGGTYTKDSVPAVVGVAHSYDLVHLLAMAIQQAGALDRSLIRDNLEKLPGYKGLVRNYEPAFTRSDHEGLGPEDFILARYNEKGFAEPVSN